MSVWKLATITLMATLLLTGCAREEPLEALQTAARSMQVNIEKKDTAAFHRNPYYAFG